MSTFFFVHERPTPPRHGGHQCCTHFWRDVLPLFLWDQFCFSCTLVLLDSSQGTYLAKSWFSLFFSLLYKLLHDFGSVLSIVIMLEYSSSAKLLESGSHFVSQHFGIYPQTFMVPFFLNVISPTPLALIQAHIITLPPPCFTVVVLARLTPPNMPDTTGAKLVYLGRKNLLPIFIRRLFMFFRKV